MSTLTDSKDLEFFVDYLDKNGIASSVDENPSPEKVSRISRAIERKNDLIEATRKLLKIQ